MITDEMVDVACVAAGDTIAKGYHARRDGPSKRCAEREMRAALETVASAIRAEGQPLQSRVAPWMQACFGAEIAADKIERRHRFTEEALELLQAMGGTKHEAIQLVDYVFSREKGEPHQEVGGVMITLAALCLAAGLDMHKAGEDELARIWTKVDAIRAKQAAKPKHSVLPVAVEPRSDQAIRAAALKEAAKVAEQKFRIDQNRRDRQLAEEWEQDRETAGDEIAADLRAMAEKEPTP